LSGRDNFFNWLSNEKALIFSDVIKGGCRGCYTPPTFVKIVGFLDIVGKFVGKLERKQLNVGKFRRKNWLSEN
jgi:hypothetical protein